MIGLARTTDPNTSYAAAASIDATVLEGLVAKAVASQGPNGATWYELESLTGLARQTISPRFAPLCRKGIIKNSGTRRPGLTNRQQIVWIAVP